MVSDDTEHACFIALALIKSQGNAEDFQKYLARYLRWWLVGMPAGVGLATLKSILKLWIGLPPSKSGIFSAGNGPAMRSPILGIVYGRSKETLREHVQRATEITHSDPKAFHGALAIALAAYQSSTVSSVSGSQFRRLLSELLRDNMADEFTELIEKAVNSAERDEPTGTFATAIGSPHGVSGYIYHTVPCVIQTWLRYSDDFAGGILEIISAGGDTDTTGAILGAILGARAGKEGIPETWLNGIIEWPRSIQWIERLGNALANAVDGHGEGFYPPYFIPGIILRNAFFLIVVLAHGFRRLAPPY
jgi:ADP-ribosylglycohydrolase